MQVTTLEVLLHQEALLSIVAFAKAPNFPFPHLTQHLLCVVVVSCCEKCKFESSFLLTQKLQPPEPTKKTQEAATKVVTALKKEDKDEPEHVKEIRKQRGSDQLHSLVARCLRNHTAWFSRSCVNDYVMFCPRFVAERLRKQEASVIDIAVEAKLDKFAVAVCTEADMITDIRVLG